MRPIDAKRVAVSVDNVSGTHLHVVRLELQQKKNIVGALRDGSYILAGERHEWTLELTRPLEAGPLSVNVGGDYGVAKYATTATAP